MEPTYPLDLHRCRQCGLVQLDEFEAARDIFDENYVYFSSFTDSWLEHCRRYVDMAERRFELGPESSVIEVASNDGYLLQYFVRRGIRALGIEPAANVAAAARDKGVDTEVAYFDRHYGAAMAARGQRADLLIANNVLAHNPDINSFVAGIASVLADSGVATLEFPHILRMIEGNQFDTIYHEHFSYLSVAAVEPLFARHGLVLFDIEQLPTHGGSLRIFAQRGSTGVHEISDSVAAVRRSEEQGRLHLDETYERFAQRIRETKWNLLSFLMDARKAAKKVVAYGAPAKGNTLLNYCGIRADLVDYTVDRNPAKQGCFLPGSRIAVHRPERIFEDRPDLILILPWNIKDEIIAELAAVRGWGGRFVIPIPSLQVIE
jgi:SAM-dependent methyltransferase